MSYKDSVSQQPGVNQYAAVSLLIPLIKSIGDFRETD